MRPFCTRLSCTAAAIALAMQLLVGPAHATGGDGRVDLDPAVRGPAWSEPGVWRTRVQQVFDARTRTLARRLYEAWDPEPSRDLEFVWSPDDAGRYRPGRIEGEGTLTWREKAKPSYDEQSIVAQFRGTLRNGRIEGIGTYRDRSGLSYDGQWKAGLMDGQGTLILPSGEEFVGQFRANKANGLGRFIDITGEIYEGPFVDGLRHGRGRTTLPDRRQFTSHWRNGVETAPSLQVRLAQTPGGVQPGGSGDIRLGITIDRTFPMQPGDINKRPSSDDLVYTIGNMQNGLGIRPDNRRLMGIWKGNGEIQLTQAEEIEREELTGQEKGVFSLSRGQLPPLKLKIEVQNRTPAPVQVTGAYLDVRTSATDLQPAIQLSIGSINTCVGDAPKYSPRFRLENLGWGAAEQATLRYAFGHPESQSRPSALTLSKSIGSIGQTVTVDVEGDLRAMGVDVGYLRALDKKYFPCPSQNKATCLNAFRASGRLGQIAQMVGGVGDKHAVEEGFVGTSLVGVLEYTWRDAAGRLNRRTSPFRATIPLAQLETQPECGEGGGRELIAARALQLQLDRSGYRLPVAFRTSVPAGRASQLIVPVAAAKSSEHDFHVVVQFSDGREIRSRPINLLYYWPSWFRKKS